MIIDDLEPQEALAVANSRKDKVEREVAKEIEKLFKEGKVWGPLQELEKHRKVARIQANRAAYIAEIEKCDAELEELTGKKVSPLRPVAASVPSAPPAPEGGGADPAPEVPVKTKR